MHKAILWDFDGTLSYPNKSFSTALYQAVCECGYSVNREDAVAFLEGAYPWKTPEIAYPDVSDEKWWSNFFDKIDLFCAKAGIKQPIPQNIHTRFKQILTDVNNYRLYDDTLETLKKCSQLGYKNYLATNNYPEIISNLELLGIAPYMTDYIVSSHIGYEKPRAEFYAYAKHLSGNPEIMYMVGDNPTADILGGKNAGLITVAVHLCKNSEADYFFENLKDIPGVLK